MFTLVAAPLEDPLPVVEEIIGRRNDDECQEKRGQESADDRDPHRRAGFGSLSDAEGNRQHPENHREGRHQDRPEPDRSGLEDRLPPGNAPPPEDIRIVDEQNRIFLHKPHQQDKADEAEDIQRISGDQQRTERPDKGERHRQKNREGVNETLELGGQDHVGHDDPEDQGEHQVLERFAHRFRHPLVLGKVVGGKDAAGDVVELFDRLPHGLPLEAGEEGDRPLPVDPVDDARPAPLQDADEVPELHEPAVPRPDI